MRQRLAPILGLLVAAALVAPASVAAAKPAHAEHDRVIAHWTPARMAAARPRDFIREPNGNAAPKSRPAPGGSTITGASWTDGGPIVDLSGKVYFEMGGGAWICSGSIVDDAGRSGTSLVLTAGHCAVDETTGDFATNWMFIPDFDGAPSYDCALTVYGCWTARALVVHYGFAHAGAFNTQATTHDWAFAVVGSGGKRGTQLDALGSFSIGFPAATVGASVAAFGYPAAGKYHGNDLTYCAGKTILDGNNATKTWGVACDMTGGSSGGPWLASFSAGSGTLTSLNSYGYSGIKNMYGPIFDAKTKATYDAARTASGNTVVGNAP
jgi:hypothetical protein